MAIAPTARAGNACSKGPTFYLPTYRQHDKLAVRTAGEDTGEGFPAFEGVMAFVEGFATLGAMPCVDEPARGFFFKCAANCEFHAFHRCLVKLIVSQVSKSRPGAPGSYNRQNLYFSAIHSFVYWKHRYWNIGSCLRHSETRMSLFLPSHP